MQLAVITSGFFSESTVVEVMANLADGTGILIYDDESKVMLGSGILNAGNASVSVSPKLFLGQRIIPYVGMFGKDTFGSVLVTDSQFENTGWKKPTTVNGVPYEEYLESGGDPLPDIYDPGSCRNFSRDKDAINQVINAPISFRLRQIETQGGTIQVTIEDVTGAVGGYKTKFDSDPVSTTLTKTYSANGTNQVKVWGVNQTEADAVIKIYTLTMPTAVVSFGSSVVDLSYQIDYGNTSQPGLRPLRAVVYSSVPVEVQIDGVHTWEIAPALGGFPVNATGICMGPVNFVTEGEYTIRCRKASDGSQALVRQIKIDNFAS